jgi:hypothetical protein
MPDDDTGELEAQSGVERNLMSGSEVSHRAVPAHRGETLAPRRTPNPAHHRRIE